MIFDRNENKEVIALLGAGSMGSMGSVAYKSPFCSMIMSTLRKEILLCLDMR